MHDTERLRTELDRFAQIVGDLAAIAARIDPERRHELIKLRRLLSDQIGVLRVVGAKALHDPDVAAAFRTRLSAVLNVVSMHQANWPAIAIDDGLASYRDSAASAATGNRTFIEWTRAVLAQQD